ncbi:YdcF family protein [Sneathiella aquimaris]|uniref:YdcF family protein n=1 Tax=Sneathiella aquimaris TaxID=2599305 RepID=UPI001469FC82|nr:YdcF family protein [Sneathiella aquimaris]
MKPRSRIFIQLLLILIALWAGAFLFYVREITSGIYSNSTSADGIVILTGTPGRLKLGFELLKTGAGKRLLVSGVHTSVTKTQLGKAMGESTVLMDCCVDLGRIAKDTVGNAYEASLWAEEHGFNDILVVTSAYHMPRSLVELRRQLPDKNLIAYAPADDTDALKRWWRSPKLLYVLVAEFNKYVISLVRARIEMIAMSGPDT